ncbi:DDE domain protein (plasmid) [Rhizobium leguminosarum bv. viciae]|jgi:putative transposase|nr:DDE domain protein [Rhizobium leguminosarum bv. viciae]
MGLVEYYQTKDALHYYLLRNMGLNNRAENSHVPPRKRERMMHGFRSAGGFQRFISVFSATRTISSRLTRNAQPSAPIVIASAHWKVVTGATA